MTHPGEAADTHSLYEGSFECDPAGRYGFTVRVAPTPPDLTAPAELGLAAWA